MSKIEPYVLNELLPIAAKYYKFPESSRSSKTTIIKPDPTQQKSTADTFCNDVAELRALTAAEVNETTRNVRIDLT